MNKIIQNCKAVLSAIVLIIVIYSVQGCTYDEGDDVAQASFDLMTTQEKAMHDKVMGQFGQKSVRSVREAVGKRSIKPRETSIPFIDISNIIKYCDQNILIPEDFKSGTDNIKKANRAKFSHQDKEWYRIILKVSNGQTPDEPPIKSKPMDVTQVKHEFGKKLELAKEKVIVDPKDLLPLDKYQDVKFLARGCEQAISIIESAAGQDRPLTEEDFNNIQYEKAVCETKKLNENL